MKIKLNYIIKNIKYKNKTIFIILKNKFLYIDN